MQEEKPAKRKNIRYYPQLSHPKPSAGASTVAQLGKPQIAMLTFLMGAGFCLVSWLLYLGSSSLTVLPKKTVEDGLSTGAPATHVRNPIKDPGSLS